MNISESGTLTSIKVNGLDITHTYIKDLKIKLIAPDNTEVVLLDEICNNHQNLLISFDDNAVNNYNDIPCPPTGGQTYQPNGSLINLINKEINGDWVLSVEDGFDEDGGSINAWSLDICFQSVLPVRYLMPLRASLEGEDVLLEWETAQEKNASHFVVERSSDGKNWYYVTQVEAAQQAHAYSLVDYNPYSPKTYYRLNQVDFDGEQAYTHIVSVVLPKTGHQVTVLPNPTNGELFIVTDLEIQQVEIFDLLGRSVHASKAANHLQLSEVPDGVYLLKVNTNMGGFIHRIIVRH